MLRGKYSGSTTRARIGNVILTAMVTLSLSWSSELAVASSIRRPLSDGWVPQPPPLGSTCSDCGYVEYYDANGELCQNYTCRGPGWPQCQDNAAAKKCTLGATFNVDRCTGTGVDRCSYTCGADGKYTLQQCTQIGNNINRRYDYCDYNAGCPLNGGYLQGKLTTIAELCTQDGIIQNVVATAACGGVCSRKLVCKPGQPCKGGEIPKTCKWKSGVGELVPTCTDAGGSYNCTFGSLSLSVPKPCPTVVRSPFPRAIVGKPVIFNANVCGNLPTASGKQDVAEPWDDCGDTVVAYEGALGWQCSANGGVEWTMDERSWNIGHTGSDGQVIQNKRGGTSVTHVYETSSYDLLPNGPGPNLVGRQPAYQVSLKTTYSLVANFKYHYRTKEHRCYDGAGNRKTCYAGDGNCDADPNRANRDDCVKDASSEDVIITPTHDLPPMVIPDVSVFGGKVTEDPVLSGTCGPIPVPVIQSQSILVP